jgi:hypothetical protein
MTDHKKIAIQRMERAHEEMLKALRHYLDECNVIALDYEIATDGHDYEDDCENLADLTVPAYSLMCEFEDRKYRQSHPVRKSTKLVKKPIRKNA